MKLLLPFITLLLLYSCKPIAKTLYGVNKEIEFKNVSEYRTYISDKYKINPDNFYYIDQTSYQNFLTDIIQNKTDYFLGTFINDSTELKKSDFLTENQSCAARILQEINQNSTKTEEIIKVKNEILKANSFSNITTHKPLGLFNGEKNKIVLIFSYKAGKVHKKDFIDIQKLIDSTTNYELVIISLDPVCYIPDKS